MPKNKSSPFMCFAMELKNKSGRNMSTQQAVSEAGKIWESMDAAERKKYADLARNTSRSAKPQEKLDCLGRSLKQVEKEREEAAQQERNMKRNIVATLKKSVRDGTFETKKYHFVMINYFTKKDGIYVPAEIAISQFSLKDGVHKKYHSLLSPETLGFGLRYEAIAHADETHMLPLPPKALGERNMAAIYKQFINFIRDPVTGEIPPVYTLVEHTSAVKSAIEFLQAESPTVDNIEVYSLQYLFFVMKEHCAEIGERPKPESIYVTDSFFLTDFFEYTVGISCDFHEEKDRSKYCALSHVVRWGYIFGEHMCQDIAIIPKPGYHVPMNTKLNGITNEPDIETECETKDDIEEPSVDADWEKRWANETQVIPVEKTFNDDFPALGARKRNSSAINSSYAPSVAASMKRENNHQIPLTAVDDYDLEASNPWSRSQRKKPQEPDNSFFSINFNSTRTNQTFLYDDDETDVSLDVPKKAASVAGRGRIL